ncbi:MAG: twin-arginine translocase subunit TatC [Gammaproteobacteria bacterium]
MLAGTFVSHLVELRQCLVRALLALLIVFLALVYFTDDIFEFVAQPMLAALPGDSQVQAIGITTSFLIPLKTVLYVALLIAMPYVLYEVWRFVAPGLYRRERRVAVPLLLSSVALFYAGVTFAYFVVFRVVFSFLFSTAPDFVVNNPDVQEFLSFWLRIILAFGLAFELPVAMFMLVRTGVVSLDTFARMRRYAFLGVFVAAMLITPPDIWSQTLLAIPMYLLYEAGLLLARTLIGVSQPPNAGSFSAPARGDQANK